MPSRLFTNLLAAQGRDIRHERMDRHDDVWIVLHDALPHGFFAKSFLSHVEEEFKGFGIGEFEDEVPLFGMGGEVFVLTDEVVVGRHAVFGLDVEEVVGGAREEDFELIGEGFGGGSVSATGVAGKEEDFEGHYNVNVLLY